MKNEVKLKCYQNYKNKCLNLLNLVKITTRSIKLRELHIKQKPLKRLQISIKIFITIIKYIKSK